MQYIQSVRQRLSDNADTSARFVAAELKRFGFKPRTAQGCVYCDIGRSRTRTAFYAELSDTYQTSVMLSFAAELAAYDIAGVRLVFDGNTDDEHDLFDGVSELYSVVLCDDPAIKEIGCCYGIACAGLLEFSLNVIGGWNDGKQVYPQVAQIAARYGMACAETDGRITLRYFDKAKCESALLDVERVAQSFDDEYGTEHTLIVAKNYPPLKNDALCVDKVRHASGGKVTSMSLSQQACGVSRYLDGVCGCTVFAGEAAMRAIVRLFLRLVGVPTDNPQGE